VVFARVVSLLLLLFCCLRTDRNFFRESEKILRQKNKKEEKHFLKHIFCLNFLQYCCNEHYLKREAKDKTLTYVVVVVYKGVHYKFKNIHIYGYPVCVSTYFTQQNNLFSSPF